ncbi:hypothetical protein HPB51_007131 [Rhipicephalus microplus]|uniref:Uncharacterized protein n=1 Tax=Rhipicephalus microplus TaxID=6941 RepID=A0A9J6E005_RHIMP|nr:hypothetical protein HPB51_007131 [Rhipicephalus microplus]
MFIKKQHIDVRKSAQKVLEPKRDSLSRLKHLRVYLDNVETAEAKTFFEINYSHIYCVFHDVFTSLEATLRQRVHKTQKEELDNVKYIFERILVLLPELLAQRWQWHSIRAIIRKFLHSGNSLRAMTKHYNLRDRERDNSEMNGDGAENLQAFGVADSGTGCHGSVTSDTASEQQLALLQLQLKIAEAETEKQRLMLESQRL